MRDLPFSSLCLLRPRSKLLSSNAECLSLHCHCKRNNMLHKNYNISTGEVQISHNEVLDFNRFSGSMLVEVSRRQINSSIAKDESLQCVRIYFTK